MEKEFRAETVATAEELFAVVNDLSTYPDWIELVHRVEPVEAAGDRVTDDRQAQPEWWVTLRATIGPFARSKRLRMSRTVNNPPGSGPDEHGHVRFERSETDGRDHAEWTMEVTVVSLDEAADDGSPRSRADCRLLYGGAMWTGLLDGTLDATARRSTESLQRITGSLSR